MRQPLYSGRASTMDELKDSYRMTRIWLRVAIVAALGLASATAGATDLAEAYHRAQRSDPQLREADATRLALREARPQAFAALLPQLQATAGYTHDNSSGLSTFFTSSGVSSYNSQTGTNNKQWALELRQSVFHWEKFAAVRQANAQVAQAEVDYSVARQSLILRTATAYFAVLAAQDTVEAAQAAREAISHQLEQAEQRFEVGLIAVTDVEEARAANDQAAATLIAAKRTLATARDQLREVTGDSVEILSRPGDDMPLVAPDPVGEDQWVRTALDQNLSLASARMGAEIARESITVAEAGHLPSVDLVARESNVDVTGSTSLIDPSLGSLTYPANTGTRDKQISLQLTVPLFSGGAVASRVRQASYEHRAAHERLERVARATERGTRDAYLGVITEISRVKALRQAVQSSRIALTATEAGYEVGTRTAVDVLLARQRLFDAQTTYARSRYDYLLNVLTLEQESGTLDDRSVDRLNALLDHPVTVR
jgi:outer membrane protein